MRVHVFGASGSGTTTLARALAKRWSVPHFDTDDYFWELTDPPFRVVTDSRVRAQRLAEDLSAHPAWTLSGSLCGWGDALIPAFTLVVFLWIPPDVRLHRIESRERMRYGARIEPGGDMHEQSREFLDWAMRYDTAGLEQRSRVLHERWLEALPRPLLRIESDAPLAEWIERVLAAVA